MRFLVLSFLIFSTTASFSQTKAYSGTWTKIHTTYAFDFDLVLKVNASNQVEGVFTWKVVRANENDITSKAYYTSKIGQTGKEYVRGTYNPAENSYYLRGYKKEDPNTIIGLDTYKLQVDETGNIGGTTSANGTWLGRINGKPKKAEFL